MQLDRTYDNYDYKIHLDYNPNTDNLANTLEALQQMVVNYQNCESILLNSTNLTDIESRVVMQDIKPGSISLFIKRIFKQKENQKEIQDNNLNNFYQSAIQIILNQSQKADCIKDKDIEKIKTSLEKAYTEAGNKSLLTITPEEIIRCSKIAEIPRNCLNEKQAVKVAIFQGKTISLNPKYSVNETELRKENFETITENNQDIKVTIKKPCYIGDGQWDVMYNNKPVKAKVLDQEWLSDFQNQQLKEYPLPQDIVSITANIIIDKKNGKEDKVELEILKIGKITKQNNVVSPTLF